MTDKCRYARFRLGEKPAEKIPVGARSVGHHTVPAGWIDDVFQVHHVAIYWGIKGVGGVAFGGERLRLEPDQIAVYFPGMVQEIYALDEDWEYCWWTMDGPLAEETVRGFGIQEAVHRVGPAPLSFITALESMIQGPGRRNEINASALAYQILSVAAQHHGTGSGGRHHEELIEAATALILSSSQVPGFNVDRLASELNIDRSTLSRRFRRATGSTLVDYIGSIRMQNATAMLRETPLSIAEVAQRCGYADPNYFSKLMRQRLGMPPTEFRKRT